MLTAEAKVQIAAHAGCLGTPPGSLDCIHAAARERAEVVETDVRFDADGEPVMSHDPLSASPRPETLERAFDVLAGYPRLGVNLDIKECRGPGALSGFAALGVQSITTNRVDLLVRLLETASAGATR